MNKKGKRGEFKKRHLFYIFILLIVLVIAFFGTRIYLYFNFLLGNDMVVTLNADKTHFFLGHGEQSKVSLKSQTLTNPFCNSECSSSFVNLDTGEIINEQTFLIKPTIFYIQEYTLTANNSGRGQQLYRFEVKCKGIKEGLCQTSAKEKTRNVLITLDYDLNEIEREIKNSSQENLSFISQNLNYMEKNLLEMNNTLSNLTNNNNLELVYSEINNLSDSLILVNETCFELIEMWNNEEYISLENEMILFNSDFQEISLKFISIKEAISNQILNHNLLFDEFLYAHQKLENLKQQNVSFNKTIEINSLINEFNFIVENEDNYNDIYILVPKIDDFNLTGEKCCYASENISNIPISKIYLNESNEFFEINFSEKNPRCCFLGECGECCDNCSNKESIYPIVFVHGHSFNHKISAEYSFDTFEELQEKLEEDGFINAGTLVSISDLESEGILGRANYPFTFRISYYFDIYKNDEFTKIISTKEESIDTYAIRLNDLIKEIKLRTGKDKVIIVAHSMGGLVSRRYMQVFGESDVAKFISIGSPHHGISKKIYDYCKIFGATPECDDMKLDSLLINKINQDVLEIPSYNIIGVGCDMDGQDGDGIVENSTAYLGFARNYYINGSCPGNFEFLHLDIMEPNKYPEAYNTLIDILRE